MEIKILEGIEGAKQAEGLTVIIDVFRAFSTACYVMHNGAKQIIAVGKIEEAFDLKKKHPEYIIIGEERGIKPEGFDYGNSPTDIEHVSFKGKIVVQRTSAGIQGIVHAKKADVLIAGSFVNAGAIVEYIRHCKPKKVCLVCMGTKGMLASDEDGLCADYIKNTLEGKSTNFKAIVEHLRTYVSAEKFFDPKKTWAPERDFDLCLNLDAFHFLLKAEKHSGQIILKRVE